MRSQPTAAGPIVEVDSLTKTYNGRARALDGLSLSVAAGTIYGLLGPNGAGKTTLIRVLATLLPPDHGTARVAGLDVRTDPTAVRARIGLAGQYAAVDELLTGYENVEMVGRLYGLPPRQARQRAREVLERIGLTSAATRPVRTYSGGMRRRLDLAASLVGQPQVLFLDEPTANLDPASRAELWALIRDLVATGTTVLLTTQYLEEADRLADRIAVIDHGRLVSEGTSDQLKAHLGGAMLEVHLPPDIPVGDRKRAVAALEGVSARYPVVEPEHGMVVLTAPDGARTLAEALRRLDAAGIAPDDVALRKPSLDEVFLTLTGRATAANPHHTQGANAQGISTGAGR
jgi:ABC-2 type transport system ATP-binding protein